MRTKRLGFIVGLVVGVAVCVAGPGAAAGSTPADRCEARKLEAAGDKVECLLKEEADEVLGHTPHFAKCNEKFVDAFSKAEAKAGPGVCPTEGDTAAIEAQIDACMAGVTASLSLTPPAGLPLCQAQLTACNSGLATCTADLGTCNTALTQAEADLSACTTQLAAAQKFPATGQTTCYDGSNVATDCVNTSGQDGNIRAGAALSYTENGDGTVTDNNTGLMWAKKDDNNVGDPLHDKDTTYTWANAFAVHIAGLNAGTGFAGHTDWRLPNVKELQSIVNYQNVNPSVSSEFNNNCVANPGCLVTACSCTRAGPYWSSTTYAGPAGAWDVGFGDGGVNAFDKTLGTFVRAVRGGS